MIVPSHEQLIASIDAFLTRHPEIGEAKFGRAATGEPGLLQRLRAGSSPTLRVMIKISQFMSVTDAVDVGVADAHEHSDIRIDCSQSLGKIDGSSHRVPA